MVLLTSLPEAVPFISTDSVIGMQTNLYKTHFIFIRSLGTTYKPNLLLPDCRAHAETAVPSPRRGRLLSLPATLRSVSVQFFHVPARSLRPHGRDGQLLPVHRCELRQLQT